MKRRGGTNLGRDEVGSVGRRHVERGELMAVAGRMQAEEGQRPVDVHAAAAGQVAAHRCALLETVEDFAYPSGVCGLRPSSGRPGQPDLSRISSSSGRVDRTMARIASSASGSGLAGPLVHEELLELDGDGAAGCGKLVVNEAGLLAPPLKRDVLAHVHLLTAKLERAQPLHERIDHMRPAPPVHRERADVDLRHQIGAGGRGIGPVAPMIVAVNIQDHEACRTAPPLVAGRCADRRSSGRGCAWPGGPGQGTVAARRPGRPMTAPASNRSPGRDPG